MDEEVKVSGQEKRVALQQAETGPAVAGTELWRIGDGILFLWAALYASRAFVGIVTVIGTKADRPRAPLTPLRITRGIALCQFWDYPTGRILIVR